MTVIEKLGKDIKRRRRELGWSIDKLSKKSGISDKSIMRIEHGDNVGICLVCSVIEALKASLEVTCKEVKQ